MIALHRFAFLVELFGVAASDEAERWMAEALS
jgi:hypothetical protein